MVQKNAEIFSKDGDISSSNVSRQKMEFFLALFVAAVAFLVYANSLSNGLVWDDNFIILGNPALKGTFPSLFNGVDSIRELGSTPYYRPLALMSFMIDNRIHGFNPIVMHLTNVLLHSLNSILIYALARTILKESYSALLVGILFAIHPISTEAVNFLSARNVLLSTAASLISYLLHAWSVRRNNILLTILGALFFTAGLFCKETVLMILPFIVLLEPLPINWKLAATKVHTAVRLAPYAVGLVVYLFMRNSALVGAGVQINIASGLGSRLLDNVFIIPRYLLNLVWPTTLSNRYFLPDDLNLLAMPLAISWLLIICGGIWLITRGRSRATIFGLAWLFMFWLPTSGIIFFPSAPMADRFFYMPAIGVWIILADQLGRVMQSGAEFRKYGFVIAMLLLPVLIAVTVARNLDWKSDITLFTRYVKQYPEVAGGHYNLGSAYMEKEQNLDMAERSFERALALDPTFPKLRTNMGFARLQRGDLAGALLHYIAALRLNPNDAEALLNSGIVLEKLFRFQEAIESYRRFLATEGTGFAESRAILHTKIQMLEQLSQNVGAQRALKMDGK